VSGIQTILLAVGPKDRENVTQFFETVTAIAGPTNATVILLHVFSRNEYEELIDRLDEAGNLKPDALAERHDDIQTPAIKFEDAGIETEVHGVIGDPEIEIVHTAEEINADLLFIGGAKRSPTGKAIFGDNAQQILLNSPCPVTYIQRE
jgi:nucleotide-binding universal stress UspA family protein